MKVRHFLPHELKVRVASDNNSTFCNVFVYTTADVLKGLVEETGKTAVIDYPYEGALPKKISSDSKKEEFVATVKITVGNEVGIGTGQKDTAKSAETDAIKRAFNALGVGTEIPNEQFGLYKNKIKTNDQGKCADKFYVSNLSYMEGDGLPRWKAIEISSALSNKVVGTFYFQNVWKKKN